VVEVVPTVNKGEIKTAVFFCKFWQYVFRRRLNQTEIFKTCSLQMVYTETFLVGILVGVNDDVMRIMAVFGNALANG
jgi:hypothetical protein